MSNPYSASVKPYAINNNGRIAMEMAGAAGYPKAYTAEVTAPASRTEIPPTVPGGSVWWSTTNSMAINNNGWAGGGGNYPVTAPWLYNPTSGTTTVLGMYGSHAAITGINDSNVAVGWASNGGSIPVVWKANEQGVYTIASLGTLGQASGQSGVGAYDINNAGIVVGTSITAGQSSQDHVLSILMQRGFRTSTAC